MATFDEAQTTSLARIFGTTSDVLGLHLDFWAGVITDSDKTAILADITAYEAIENDNVEVSANLKNFGANVSADKKRSLIKRRIAALIGWEMSSGASLVRG